jgi:DNA/RNA-binding domain of Phe-tRNA-synthetase-like protein
MINYFQLYLEVESLEIQVSSEIAEKIPTFKLGIIEYQNITVGDSPQMVKGRLQLFQESIYFDLEETNLTDLPGIQEWRMLFKLFGKDPKRYPHSAEALYRRVQKQNYLTPVHSAVDLNTFFSFQYQVPIGVYDADQLKSPIVIRIGQEGEGYLGLNGRLNSLNKLIVSSDKEGPFGSPYVDSSRAPVTLETRNALQIIYLRPSNDLKSAEKLTESLMKMFVQVHGGQGSFRVIECP